MTEQNEMNRVLVEFAGFKKIEIMRYYPMSPDRVEGIWYDPENKQSLVPNFFDPITGMSSIFKWVVPELRKQCHELDINFNYESAEDGLYALYLGEDGARFQTILIRELFEEGKETEALANACVALVEKLKVGK